MTWAVLVVPGMLYSAMVFAGVVGALLLKEYVVRRWDAREPPNVVSLREPTIFDALCAVEKSNSEMYLMMQRVVRLVELAERHLREDVDTKAG